MIRYRSSLTLSLFFKGYLAITQQLARRLRDVAPLPAALQSAATSFSSKPPKSSQYYFLVNGKPGKIKPKLKKKKKNEF